MELSIFLNKNGCLNQVEIEQRIWFYIEELQAVTIVVHALENTLFAISQDHEAEKQKLAQEVDK